MAQAIADAEDILELDDQPDEERDAEQRIKRRNADYPKPDLGDIEDFVQRQREYWRPLHSSILVERERRFMRDETPAKWQRNLKDGRRFYSRLTYNEILTVVGAQTDNPPKVNIEPSGRLERDRDKANKEKRFCQHLLPALEKKAGPDGLRRMWVDGQVADGLVAYEVYLDSDAYDAIDTEPKEVMDPKTGRYRTETDDEVMERTESQMQNASFPIGMRVTIADSLFFDRDENGDVKACVVIENKPRPLIRRQAMRRGYWDRLNMPSPHAPGVPAYGGGGQRTSSGSANDAETWRYYDERWYAYVVDGKLVEGPKEHRLPGVPVFVGPGIITSSPNVEDKYQGITAGMGSIELAVNDYMTIAIDQGYMTAKPKYVVEAEMGADLIMPEGTNTPERLDLTSDGVLQLNPGQKIVNVMADHNPFIHLELFGHLLGFWGKSALNPVAMGQSPGANAAGYTVSALQDSAWTKYRDNINTEARVLERVIDFVRKMIRDTIRDKVWLSVPMADRKEGGTEWLALGPDDITETPCTVTINPFTEQQKFAKRQSLMEGNAAGFVARSRVMREGYDVEDVQAESDELILDAAEQITSQWSITSAMEDLRMMEQPAIGVGPDGMPVDTQGQLPGFDDAAMQAAGGIPAPPNAPSVGAEQSAASQDPFAAKPGMPGGMGASQANAGMSNNNYQPPNRKV